MSQYSLIQLGWQPFFQQQLSLDEWQDLLVARVVEQQRSELHLLTEQGSLIEPITSSMPPMTVGDWILIDHQQHFIRLLDRLSFFSRKAAGSKVATQLIAANIDTVFIVTSLNQDFNLNRIERYLSLAHEAGVESVIVLTKVDLCELPQGYIEKVRALDALLPIVSVNSLDAESVNQLEPWCKNGKTIAFLGSSGVGKSSLINTLLGKSIQSTQSIRQDDEKGRHTTTSRSIHLLPSGALLLDTPGMRELQLADCEQGVEETFSEIIKLAQQCRFNDCTHQSEPGCAVRKAIEKGELDERRLNSYVKLIKEQAHNQATLAEKRAKEREFGRYVRSVMKSKHNKRN